MKRFLAIWILCASLAVAQSYEFKPLPTTEKWCCLVCGLCVPRKSIVYIGGGRGEGWSCQFQIGSPYDSMSFKQRWFETDNILPIAWGHIPNTVIIVDADTIKLPVTEQYLRRYGRRPFRVDITKTDTIWHKGKVE